MSPAKPYSLSADQTYAIIARLLYISDLLPLGQTVDAQFLSDLQMPNWDGFR